MATPDLDAAAKTASGGSLFERLDQAAGRDLPGAADNVIESIKCHLVRLLNSHPGHSPSAPALGLVDFNDATYGTQDLSIRIRTAIRRCIEHYEPRVYRCEVMALPQGPDPLHLRFQVTVYVQVGESGDRATIDLLLDEKRRYHVV